MMRQTNSGKWYCAECNETFTPHTPDEVICPHCGQRDQHSSQAGAPEERRSVLGTLVHGIRTVVGGILMLLAFLLGLVAAYGVGSGVVTILFASIKDQESFNRAYWSIGIGLAAGVACIVMGVIGALISPGESKNAVKNQSEGQ